MEIARRVQKTGGGTFILSLPKEWASQQGLQAGSTAFLEFHADGSLGVRATPRTALREWQVETGTDVEHSLRRVISGYIGGADSIRVRGPMAAAVAEEARLRLSALEIMEEGGDQVRLQVFEKGDEFSTDALLRRMYVVIGTMFELVCREFSGRADTGEELARRGQELDRLYFLFLRSASKEGRGYEALVSTLAAKKMESIGDLLEMAGTEGQAVAPNARVAKWVERTEGPFRGCFESLYKRTYQDGQFEEYAQLKANLEKDFTAYIKAAKNPEETQAFFNLRGRLKFITIYSKDILELAVDLTEYGKQRAGYEGPLKRTQTEAQ